MAKRLIFKHCSIQILKRLAMCRPFLGLPAQGGCKTSRRLNTYIIITAINHYLPKSMNTTVKQAKKIQNNENCSTIDAKFICMVRCTRIMSKTLLLLALVLLCAAADAQLQYKKEYNGSNTLLSEGWMENGTRVKYWKFYTAQGILKEEGHFKAGKRSGYWYFYNEAGNKTAEGSYANDEKTNWWKFYVNGKKESAVQYSNNQRNGYCLRYSNGDVYKCEKYKNDSKTGEWTDMASFRKDNPDF
jgi:hypothetical protein